MTNQITKSPDENSNLPLGASNLSPVPVGVTIKTKIERGDAYAAPEIFDVEIAILEIARGQAELARAVAQGVPDEPPEAGFEYILARVRFGYFLRGRGFGSQPYKLTEGQFTAVSADGKTHYKIAGALQQAQPQMIYGDFSPGESREGWILMQVPKQEKEPLLIYNREYVEGVYGIWGYVWFQLY
ncbi:hypothetical protein ACFL7M_10885 [Thermodesulfobacteriota bacterium]